MKPTNSPTKIIKKKGTLLKQLLSKDKNNFEYWRAFSEARA